MQTHMRGSLLTAALLMLALTSPSRACNVPVFRYALERWPADPYEVLIFHRGPLSAQQDSIITQLEKSAIEAKANLTVERVDLDDKPDAGLLKLYEAQKKPELPLMVVRFPAAARSEATVWAGPSSLDIAKTLIDSPARRELVKRIGAGEVAVWLLLECGDRAKDDAAARVLQARLEKLKTLLKLPELTDSPADRVNPDGPPLKVAFSVLRLSREDAAERLLVRQLLLTEDDLHDKKEPMAFPVFGRGRARWALVGKGINDDTIDEAGSFLVGPCSCQVKRLNPGTDLLIAADWEAVLEGKRVVKDKELPPLRGLIDFVLASQNATPELLAMPPRYEDPEPPPSEVAELLMFPPRCVDQTGGRPWVTNSLDDFTATRTSRPPSAQPETAPLTEAGNPLLRNILLASMAGLLIVGGLGILLWSRSPR